MELGALICTPRSPDCTACPVAKHCVAYREDRIAELPRPKQRTVATTRRILAFIIEHDGKFLVQQRAAGVVNAHLWEFPNVEAPKGRARHSVRAALLTWANGAQGTDAPCAAEDFHLVSMKPFYAVKHSITRYRITTEAFRVPVSEPVRIRLGGKSAWRTPAQLRKLPFTSAHRKIAARL
jgi:A/G-specific adenine glycosylase